MSETGISEHAIAVYEDGNPSSASARLNFAAWAIAAGVAVVDYVWMQRAGFAVTSASFARNTWPPLMLAVSVLILRGIARMPRYSQLAASRHIRDGCALVNGFAVMLLFTQAAIILQNLCVALAPPVIDSQLIALDAALGFHWPDLFAWQLKHHDLNFALGFVYVTYTVQVTFTIIVLGVAKRTDDLADFVLLFMVSVVAAILISAPFPASNPLIHFGVYRTPADSPWSQFYALREGAMRVFDLDIEQGLISMPSLHAANAVLFVYALRHLRWLFPISAVLNAVMIYSAITVGAHYLVDIIAGVLLATLLIAALRRWRIYQQRRRSS